MEKVLQPPIQQKQIDYPSNSVGSKMILFPICLCLALFLFLLELAVGTVHIPIGEVVRSLFGVATSETTTMIVTELRLPRAITASLGGMALGVAGLQLQTLFKNPLADTWTLGLTAGSQLGVALVVVSASVIGSSFLEKFAFLGNLGIVVGAALGCFLVLLMMLAISRYVSTITLLIFGLMLGFFAQGLVSVIIHFTNQSQGKIFSGWNDGSFSAVYWEQLPILAPLVLLGLLSAWIMAKPLNALLLGENYAQSLGLNIKVIRISALLSAVLLAAPITAYCGPVLFLGLIAPHLARGLFGTSDHRILIPAVILVGAVLSQGADLCVHLPWERHFLHLNAVNAVIGAPVVMWVILKNKKMRNLEI